MVLDNGAFHKAKTLTVQDNIVLLFLPPYAPELNPAEKIWQWYKRDFTNRIHKTLNHVSLFIQDKTLVLNHDIVISISRYSYIFSDYWTI